MPSRKSECIANESRNVQVGDPPGIGARQPPLLKIPLRTKGSAPHGGRSFPLGRAADLLQHGVVKFLTRLLFRLSLGAAALQAGAALGRMPNLVILYADDMGYGDLGANRSKPGGAVPTPHLDRLAAGGLRFTDGHSSSGICSPSRYAMLTGRYHWRDFHGIVGPFGGTVFKKNQLTLSAMLRQSGYHTACIGKWHLGFDWDAIRKPGAPKDSIQHGDYDWGGRFPGGPLDHGFDHYFGDNVINFPPYAWIRDDRLPAAPDATFATFTLKPKEGAPECRPGPGRSDWDFHEVLPTLTREGVSFIRSRKGVEQPFFLYFALPSPHAPIIPSDRFDGRSKAGAYGDFVVETDDACGQLLDALRECGLEDDTIVVFSSDNGPEFYAYARDERHGHWSAAPLRGLKRDLYEGGHRVPFLLRWPGVTRAGSVTDALISQIDLMATFASLLGFKLPDDAAADSHDFLPWLRGQTPKPPRNELVHNTDPRRYAIRSGDWVLINAPSGYARKAPATWDKTHGYPADDNGPVELHHLRDDPGQRRNLASSEPRRVAEMKAMLKGIREGPRTRPIAR